MFHNKGNDHIRNIYLPAASNSLIHKTYAIGFDKIKTNGVYLLSDLCSMKVSIGTFQTGPLRKLTRLSSTQEPSSSPIFDSFN